MRDGPRGARRPHQKQATCREQVYTRARAPRPEGVLRPCPSCRASPDPPTCAASTRSSSRSSPPEIRETIIADRRRDRRPPRLLARRRRAHDRAPPAARVAARPDRLGHRPPGLRAQAADRPARAVRDAAPARRHRRLPAPLRESPHDVFDGGHAGTGLSIAEGLAEARDLRHGLERIAVVVGDAALMSGLSLEALNDIGQRQTQMLIVLNDNEMSISPTVGAFSTYLVADQAVATPGSRARAPTTGRVERIPVVGADASSSWSRRLRAVGRQLRPARASCSRTSGSPTSGSCPATTSTRCSRRSGARSTLPGPDDRPRPDPEGPRLPAGRGATRSASTAPPCRRWTVAPGGATRRDRRPTRCRPSRWRRRRRAAGRGRRGAARSRPNYTAVFAAELIELAADRPADRRRSPRACRPGPGMAQVPGRVPGPDVRRRHRRAARGDARDRASRWAGMRPVVALYSTFLQRAFDQTVHDVCQNDQPVVIARRPGRPRRRGRHQPPGHVHAARPSASCRTSSSPRPRTSRSCARCSARRSPRTTRSRCTTRATPGFGLRAGRAGGPSRSARARSCARAATCCSSASGRSWRGRSRRPTRSTAEGWSVGVINARFAKPLDRQLILDQARGKRLVVTFEESVVDRRLRQRRPRAARGGPAGRPGLPRRRRSGSSASRATGSWTTARSRTCAASCASTRRASPPRSARRSTTLGHARAARGAPIGDATRRAR